MEAIRPASIHRWQTSDDRLGRHPKTKGQTTMARHTSGPRLGKSPAGYYEIRWTEEGRSRRLSTGATDMVEAQQFFAGWLHEKARDPKRPPSVKVILQSYLKEHIKDPETRDHQIGEKMIEMLGDIPVDALTTDRIAAYCEQRGVSAPTQRRELSVLIAALNYARKHRRIDPVLIPLISLPDSGAPKTSSFSEEQLELVLRLSAPKAGERASRIHRFVWIAAETASRRAAVQTLTWRQVDLKAGVIRFADELGGKVRKRKRRVTVPISSRLMIKLIEWKAEATSEFVLDTDTDVFRQWTQLVFKAATAGEDPSILDLTPHDLRRTWATLAAKAGVSMWDIAGILGDSLPVVIKHYAQHSPDYLRKAINFRSAIGA
jgi:integrase